MSALPQEELYTYADLLSWDDSTRYELYDGQPVALASPSNAHQMICMEISRQIANYLVGKRCKVYPAPFDVRLFEESGDTPEDVSVVVQPDISIVCDPGKTDGHGCKGAPDLVIEVTSPATARYDNLVKFNLYLQAGVREYWIVDPAARMVSVYTLTGGHYLAAAYGSDSSVRVGVLDDCTVDLSTVFPEAVS